jgi:hypothetical protein
MGEEVLRYSNEPRLSVAKAAPDSPAELKDEKLQCLADRLRFPI